MRDFTRIIYRSLLETLARHDFSFQSFEQFLENPLECSIILRNDVDKNALYSLESAKILNEIGYTGTYYFRELKEFSTTRIIQQIAKLGHEIGYHYEDLDTVRPKANRSDDNYEVELVELGIESFHKNLDKLRQLAPVKTICMHGSPLGKWDSRLLWKYYDYHDFGIIGEPYFDINFSSMAYLTDTGRRWDGNNVSIRDKAFNMGFTSGGTDHFYDWKVKPMKGCLMNMSQISTEYQILFNFRSTFDIIKAVKNGVLPRKIMMTFHPQRWADEPFPWARELFWQNLKNAGKYLIVKFS